MLNHPPRTNRLLITAMVAGFIGVAAPAWGQVIHEDLKLLARDGGPFDNFGVSIAIDNGVIAVGAPLNETKGARTGSAYLLDASTGEQIAKLVAIDGTASDRFGASIAMDNGVVAVGAVWDNDNGEFSGSAYIFDAATGAQIAKLLPSDGSPGDEFGVSIAIDNGIVAVGAWYDDNNSGSAYLFDASTGAQIAKLSATDRAPGDKFGKSIAIDNGVVAVGALFEGTRDPNRPYLPGSGSAYLFDASTGVQIAKLVPDDAWLGDEFGFSIAIDNGVVAIGSLQDDDNGGGSGSAYLFDASTGAQIVKLLPDDGGSGDNFGVSIAIDNGVVGVGAFYDNDNGFDSGSAYLFDASTGAQIVKLLASDAVFLELLGASIAIDNGVVGAGARNDDDNGSMSGSAYVFSISCPADIDGDGDTDADDFFAYLDLFANGDAGADIDGDGDIDADDFFGYLDLFAAGCD